MQSCRCVLLQKIVCPYLYWAIMTLLYGQHSSRRHVPCHSDVADPLGNHAG